MLDLRLGFYAWLLTLSIVNAQMMIQGKISDNQGPLPGVNVLVEGTDSGVISDFDGHFQINVPTRNQVLIFSFIGYQTQRVEVTSDDLLQVIMQLDRDYLDEVVVVGYGTQIKSNLVGSVVSVDVEEANQIPTTNISELLRGRAAGVQVNLGDPRPGGFSNIVIRGNVSVAGGNNPLIIVDGLPYDNLNDIPADDIASIEILKDASSTAIYGARASNGVILVTTKIAGEMTKPRFSYSNYITTQRLTRNFDLYTGEQFADLRRQANRNRRTGNYLSDGIIFSPFEREAIEKNLYVNWEDLVLDDALLTNHTLSVTTGGPRTKWYSSINYFNQSGIIPNSKYNRLSFKLNLNQKLTEKINVDVIVNYQDAIQEKETGGLNFTTITPLAKPFDDQGNLLKYYLGPTDVSFVNPLWD
ncbi:MAG: SusC/RagA family TonB-linked outer membrane protein, partial [Aestuariivita sp.]|nr:SusC/RagA family TonB-linked outer membrane protein [Aestuariivita sp.]